MSGLLHFLVEPLRLLYLNAHVLRALYKSDLRGRFAAGNVLGWAWLVLYPLLFVSSYALVFVGLLASRTGEISPAEQILLIFIGFVPWWGISETLAAGTALVHANASLMKNNIFPLELLAVRATVVSMTQMLIALLVVLVGQMVFSSLRPSVAQVPLLFLIVTIGCIGTSWFMASIGAFFRDLSYAVNILIMIMMILSPIGYTEAQASGTLKAFLAYNPLTYVIRAFRETIAGGRWLALDELGLMTLAALSIFYIGYYLFSRLKPMFPDLV